jgi:hypothetical protein
MRGCIYVYIYDYALASKPIITTRIYKVMLDIMPTV